MNTADSKLVQVWAEPGRAFWHLVDTVPLVLNVRTLYLIFSQSFVCILVVSASWTSHTVIPDDWKLETIWATRAVILSPVKKLRGAPGIPDMLVPFRIWLVSCTMYRLLRPLDISCRYSIQLHLWSTYGTLSWVYGPAPTNRLTIPRLMMPFMPYLQ